ncbi:recombinase family protein [Brevibacillus agri]|uniref:recombinase family protein n=1 Tax=Brevibacillus TaxID=55080 RepID=UPI001EE53C5D|nr:recombinase family protein [Brevibacillus agri]MCG5253450.1 recombinase family protein [Brevibacillus agri]MED1646113.1 recombinase family protein [Brevibacillus agri]MED1653067.1 recombinase family protein [Brevibacillus agri]MED1685783.1 recombinase family protein [Brevibacillus agri]MED1694975.1 recombinase family protein [Brevibacillus agri]
MNVVAYLRVSSKQQTERELSIPAQREAIQRYADQKGWSIVEEFVDESKSAKTADRPAFQRMIAKAKQPQKNFQAILVHKFDRFSRSREDHIIYKALLKKQGIFVYSVTEQTEPDTPHGVLLEGMLEVISEFYNLNLRNETLKGMKENASRGFHCGGRIPYGYRTIVVDGHVTLVPGEQHEVEAVQLIFKLAAEGMGGKKIARILNEYNLQHAIDRRWSPSTVLSILDNQVYLGHRIWNKRTKSVTQFKDADEWIVVPNSHPPIVSQQQWDAAHTELQQRKKNK